MDDEHGWYYRRAGEQYGPVGVSELRRLVGSGELSGEDFVWHEGLVVWSEAGKVADIMDGAVKMRGGPPPFPVSLDKKETGAGAGIPAQKSATNNAGKAGEGPVYVYRDGSRLTAGLVGLLILGIVAAAASLVTGAMQLDLLQRAQSGSLSGVALSTAATQSDELRGLVAIPFVVAFFGTIVMFCFWTLRMARNTRALGAQDMKISPGWAVGWYFVPIANLFMPYRAMKEIWKASQSPQAWQELRRGAVLPWWWGLFLASSILGNMEARVTLMAKTMPQLTAATAVSMASDILYAASAVVALILVRDVQGAQTRAARSRGLSE